MANDVAQNRINLMFHPHFSRKLVDGSHIVGFKGSRFHAHMFQDGDVLVGLLTENSKGGLKKHTKRIEVKLTEVRDIRSRVFPKRMRLPPETEALFLDWSLLKNMMRRVILGLCPPDIVSFFDMLGDPEEESPELHEYFYRLADWELREPGILFRCSLEDARKKYPLNMPCCVLVSGMPIFGTLQEDGVTIYPEGFPPEYLQLIRKILKTDERLSPPIIVGNEEVRLSEEFMNELQSLYDEVVGR